MIFLSPVKGYLNFVVGGWWGYFRTSVWLKEIGTEITAAVILTPSLYLFNKRNITIGLVGHYQLAYSIQQIPMASYQVPPPENGPVGSSVSNDFEKRLDSIKRTARAK